VKRSVIPAALCFALSVVSVRAYEPTAPPPPADPGAPAKHSLRQVAENAGENIFIGHFGETLRLDNCWAVDAKMQGLIERVNFHFKTVDPTKIFSAPFSPEAKDFIPENFARLRLMQMLVIPKDVPGGFRSLEALREAKVKELNSTGNPFDLRKIGDYPWPPETFSVSISTPYPLFQLYTQSDKNIFIVTVGEDPFASTPRDRFLASSASGLFHSLSTYSYQFVSPPAERISSLDLGLAALPWAGICVIAVALGFLPKNGKWLGRLRLIGRMTFGLATAAMLICVPIFFISMSHGMARTINQASILFCAGLIFPWVCGAAAVRLNGRRSWRVFAWSAVANIFPVSLSLVFMAQIYSGPAFFLGPVDLLMLTLTLGATALLNGAAFGLAQWDSES